MLSKETPERKLRNWIRSLVLCVALSASVEAAAGDENERAFVLRYHCLVVGTLEAIHATPMETKEDQNRFLILDRPERHGDYVQCVLVDWDREAFCEAASGYFENAAGVPRSHLVTGQSLKALVRLGFSADDSHGNFIRRFPINAAADFPTVADFLLASLYESFSGFAGIRMGIEAPDATQHDIESKCQRVS